MIRASIARRTSDGTAGAAALEIIAPPSRTIYVREVWITLGAATSSIFGLGRPQAAGITPTTPVALLTEESSKNLGNVLTTTAIAWGTGPTVPSQFYRRAGLANTFVNIVKWTFRNLSLAPGETLVVWNIGTNAVADVSVVVDEQEYR